MKRCSFKQPAEAIWRRYSHLHHRDIPGDILSWLLDASSLTQRLIEHCDGKFAVDVIDEGRARPLASERRLLGMRCTGIARVRQVRLLCDGVPVVFARTIIPYKSLSGPVRRLTMLGSRPLGAVLFADPGMRRGTLELARIGRGEQLYRLSMRGLKSRANTIWGRRSVFYLAGKPLLVNEIFLPTIRQQPDS